MRATGRVAAKRSASRLSSEGTRSGAPSGNHDTSTRCIATPRAARRRALGGAAYEGVGTLPPTPLGRDLRKIQADDCTCYALRRLRRQRHNYLVSALPSVVIFLNTYVYCSIYWKQ